MSRAYCLTCNEQVHETPSGTCPFGHPVATEDLGPEPWVGFAGDTGTDLASVQMHQLDAAGRPREHAGVGHHAIGTPHVNGSANGHASSLASAETAPPTDGTGHPAPPSADDELSALLAEALRDNALPEEPHSSAHVDSSAAGVDPTAAPAPAHDDNDWDELASLAAELHLDEDVATDDGPGAPPDELSAVNIDDLLAELTGDTTVSGAVAPEVDPDPAPHAPAVTEPTPAPPPPASAAPPPPPPPAAPAVDDMSVWDAPAPSDDVRSVPAADPADIWAEPDEVPAVDTPTATTVDLYNFTARGTRVGEAGAARPARKKRGRKR